MVSTGIDRSLQCLPVLLAFTLLVSGCTAVADAVLNGPLPPPIVIVGLECARSVRNGRGGMLEMTPVGVRMGGEPPDNVRCFIFRRNASRFRDLRDVAWSSERLWPRGGARFKLGGESPSSIDISSLSAVSDKS